MRPISRLGYAAAGLAGAMLALPAMADAPQVTYPIVGVIDVSSAENAVGRLQLGLYGTVAVAADGSLSGGGAVIYTWMEACQWAPPNPDATAAPWCRIDGVTDAAFTVSGSVVDWVHRHDEDNPLTADVFALADNHSAERLDYAPLTLEVAFQFEGALAEHLSFWGFSAPGIEARDTEAALLGALVSGLFDAPYQVPAVDGANMETVRRGNYAPSPLTATSVFGLLDVDPAALPTATDPWVWLRYPDNAPEQRPLSAAELAAIEAYESGDPPRTSDFDREVLQGALDDLVEGLMPFIEGDIPLPRIGLLDDTRAR